MPRIKGAEQALNLIASSSRQQYICRTCRAQAIRQLHTSHIRRADVGFFKRIQDGLFGTKESREKDKTADEQTRKKTEERAKRDAAREALEIKTDRKGREYEVAAIVDSSINPEYAMSTNWDGLERIGGEKWVKRKADRGEQYVGFVAQKQLDLNDRGWQALLHHVTVQVLTLQNAGRDLDDVCSVRTASKETWDDTMNTQIVHDAVSGDITLSYQEAGAENRILTVLEQPSVESDNPEQQVLEPEAIEEEELDEEAAVEQHSEKAMSKKLLSIMKQSQPTRYSEDMPWMSIPLGDPILKFTISKRILQLTAHRIPDHTLSTSSTLADLYSALKTKEPPKKLAQTAELKQLNHSARNVVVHPTRRTPIHKDKAVGRWKIIEEELVARDLPVTGSRWAGAKPRIGVAR